MSTYRQSHGKQAGLFRGSSMVEKIQTTHFIATVHFIHIAVWLQPSRLLSWIEKPSVSFPLKQVQVTSPETARFALTTFSPPRVMSF